MSGRRRTRGANESGARARGKSARASAPRAAHTAQRGRGSAAGGVPADPHSERPQRIRTPPAPFQTNGPQRGKRTGQATSVVAGATEPRGGLPAPRRNKTSGASYLQSPAADKSKQKLKPNNAVIDTACINKIQAAAKLVGLQQAIGLESISESGYYAAVHRMKTCGHATPPKPKQRPGRPRKFPLGSPEFDQARAYLEAEKPRKSYREAALDLKPRSSAATLARSFGNASADSNARSKNGLRSTEAGLKPLTSKKCQNVTSETNMPRLLDCFCSWHEAIKNVRTAD